MWVGHDGRIKACTGPVQRRTRRSRLHKLHLLMSSAQLLYTSNGVLAALFSGSVHLHPAGAVNWETA